LESSEKCTLNGRQARPRVLFVPQWYPDLRDHNSVTGTFCREHVHAASLFDDVAVLVFRRRKDHLPTLSWQAFDDNGIPTFYAAYGSPIEKFALPFFYAHLWRALKRSFRVWGRPHLIHTQDILAYHVILAARSLNVPFVMSQHWSGFMERKLDDKTLRRFKWTFGRVEQVLAANQYAAADYDHYGLCAPVRWLPNALDTTTFYPPQRQEREPWLLHASGFTPEKRFPDIVEAFRQVLSIYPRAVLQVVGDGPNRAEMEQAAARRLPLSNFRFHGFLSKGHLAGLMRQSRGFVLASDAETFGCVLMEAMACGCPVLTTRVGGIPAVVRSGEGITVEVGNIEQIAEGMGRLLDESHGLDLDRISHETRERFSRKSVGLILHRAHLEATK
jgi:glycosyltransferase involved in cell wall biosynthesis